MRAHLFQLGKKMVAHPTNQTTAGFYVDSQPYLLIEDQTPVGVGSAVRSALAAFQADIPTLSRQGQRTIRPRGARLVRIEKKEAFAFVPQLDGGAKGENRGYHALAEKKITLPAAADDAALGAACLKALELCE